MTVEARGDTLATIASVADCLWLPSLVGAEVRGGHAGLSAPVRWATASGETRDCAPGELRVLARLIDGGGVRAAHRGGAVALAAPIISEEAGEVGGDLDLPVIEVAPGTDLALVVSEVLDHVVAALDSTLIGLARVTTLLGTAASDDLRVGPISEALATATGAPVLVEDAAFEVVTAVGDAPRGAGKAGPHPRTAGLRDVYARLAASRRPLRLEADPSIGAMLPRLVAPIVGAGEVLGFCTLVLRPDGGGQQVAAAALEQARHLLAAALLHQRGIELGGRMARGSLLVDILESRSSPELLAARSAQLGVELAGRLTVVALRGPADGRPQRWRTAADEMLGPGAGLVEVVADSVVAVLAGGDHERWNRWCVRLLGVLGGGVAVLGRSVTTTGLPDAYTQARRVLDLACRGQPGTRVLDLEHLGLLGLLVEGSSTDSLDRFWRSRIGVLHDHDERHSTDLCGSLAALLDEGGLRPAARRLGVHPNTLAYRLERAQLIAGLCVDDPERRLELQLALRCRSLVAG